MVLLFVVGLAAVCVAQPNPRDMAPGYCVQLGCGDGVFAADARLSVHVLDADPQNVERLRAQLQARDLYGIAAVEQWNAPWLPYADNLVNVLIAENPGNISQTEMLRVLAPLGTLWLKRNGAWEATRKPWPREFDEWTHWRHGPEANMVSHDTAVALPTGIRWIAGPAQDAGGRRWYNDHVLVTAAGRNFYQFDDEIVARDSFNGRLLWRRAAKPGTFSEQGVTGGLKIKVGSRVSKVKPVATADHLFVVIDGTVVGLDAATGGTAQQICAVDKPREIVFAENLLLVSDKTGVRAFAGSQRWHWPGIARRMVAADGKLFCLASNEVVALTLSTGQKRWQVSPERVAEAQTCSYGSGVLALECSSFRDEGEGSGIVVLDANTGKLLWTRDYIPGMTHYKEARTWFTGGLLWVQQQITAKPPLIQVLGLDPRTGNRRKLIGTRGLHCSTPVATDRFFIAPELEFTDWQTGEQSRARMVRHSCRLPYVPANGLLNTFPLQCECYPILRGYIGLAQTPPKRDSGATILVAHSSATDKLEACPTLPTDWPIYRHDVFRSAATATSLAGDLQTLWTATVAPPLAVADFADNPFVRGPITPPVCAGSTLLLALPDRHRVVALNATTGKARWSFTAGGRVDTPPTIAGARCVFGAHDGYVYCLSVADGRLAWRFRAAPSEARIAVHGQMESPWPVAGSVLVDDGTAYFAAGRHPSADGGVRVFAVRVADAKLLWEKTVTDLGVKAWYSGLMTGTKQKWGVDFEPVDMLVRDGDCVAMSRWRFDARTGAMKLAITSTNYTAVGDVAVPRGLWGYGIRQTKSVLDKTAAVFDSQSVTHTSTNNVAAVLAGETLVVGSASGELSIGNRKISIGTPLLRDGLIVAGGRLYVATRDGRLICLGSL